MRGLSTDSAYLASLLGQIPGPVVLVGHSYGGAVISNVRGARVEDAAVVGRGEHR
jgi:thioesterase domain-containing protein